MIGRVLAGRYELDEIVGQGGMATVYRAHDQALGRDVALKVLRDQYAADPEFVERFDREARGAARLAHPNVVDIYDVGSDDGMRYLVMELVEGENLKSLIRRSAPLPPALVIRLGREIAAALDYAHRRGLIHRDVKPQNVLIDAEGHAKLTDFGIVEAAGSAALTETGTVLGTAQYMAPEQARGRSVGPPSDIYSLGVVLYEMATGRLPFEGETPLAIALRHVQDEPTPPRRLNPSLPPALEAVILRAMAKDPARRYPSAAALAEELEGGPDPIRQRTTRMASVDGERGRAGGRPAAGPGATAIVRRPPPRGARPARSAQGRPPTGGGRGAPLVLLSLVLASLVALALGFIWLFGAARPASPPAPTATPQPVVVSRPTAPPPTATQPPPTATPAAPTATPAPTPTRVPPTATRPPAAPTAPPTPAVARVAVPKLVGLSLGAAQTALGDRNLIMGFQNGSDPSQPDGVVLEQNPKEGEMVAPRSTVQVVVNKLPAAGLVTVPNVMGMEQDAARKTLEQAGLKVSVGQKSGGHKGSVDDQSPEGGQKVPPGSEVKITIGS